MVEQLNARRFEAPLPPRQGQSWDEAEDHRLHAGYSAGRSGDSLANAHGRTSGAIYARLRKLGLIDTDGNRIEPAPTFAACLQQRDRSRAAYRNQKPRQVFAVTTPDGWQIEIQSNRPLDSTHAGKLVALLTESMR